MKKIINIILSSILTIAIITTILYNSISNSLATNNIRNSIKNNLLTGFIYNDNGSKTEIFNTILKLTGLDEETIIKIMENETANNIITDIVNSIYDYNLTGDNSYKYTKEQIIKLLEDNIDKVSMEIDYPLSPKEREDIIKYTKDNTQYIIDTIYATDIGGYTK